MLRKIALVGVGLVVVGVGGMVLMNATGRASTFSDIIHSRITFPLGGSSFHQLKRGGDQLSSGNYSEQRTLDGVGLTTITVAIDVAAVNVHASSDNQVHVHAYGVVHGFPTSDLTFSATRQGNAVSVDLHRSNHDLSIGNNTRLTLDIAVPQSDYQSFTVNSKVGKIDVQQLTAKQLNIGANTGAITVQNETGAVSVHSNTGAIKLSDIQGDIQVKANMGAVSVTHVNGTMNIQSNMGAIRVDETTITHDITVHGNVGEVTVQSETPPTALQFQLKTTIGAATVGLSGAQYTSQSRGTVSGSIGSGGGPMVDLEVDTGAVELK